MSYRRYEDSDRSPRAGQKRWHNDRDDRYGDRNRDDRSPQKRRRSDNDPAPPLYTIFQGEIATVKDYGLFVKIEGTRRQGLVHKSQISQSRVEDASDMFSAGEMVYCKVISLDNDRDRIGLGMKYVDQKNGHDLDPDNTQLRPRGDFNRSPRSGQKRWHDHDDDRYGDRNDRNRDDRNRDDRSPQKRRRSFTDPAPPLYTIFQGEVATVKDYGLFVKIPDSRRQGLVHKSQISQSRIDDASDMYEVGETVYCKVISIDDDGEKIALGMKNVNQSTGQDYDPNNVQQGQDDKKRQQWKHNSRPKIELDAAYDTVCRKCGGKGHLAHECYRAKGDDSYELIPDLDEYMEDIAKSKKTESTCKKKKKKEKKHKKEKKSHRRERSTSSDTDSESDPYSRLKQKKHRRQSRTSESESDSDIRAKPKEHHQSQRRSSLDGTLDRQTKNQPSISEADSDAYKKMARRNKRPSFSDADFDDVDQKMKRKKKRPSPSDSESDDERHVRRKKNRASFSETDSDAHIKLDRKPKHKSHRSSKEIPRNNKQKPEKHRQLSYSSYSGGD